MRAKDARSKIALVDYGIGNLRSVQKALEAAGAEVCLTSDSKQILDSEKVVLPGVGAFGDGMKGLHQRGLVNTLQEAVERGTPILGICLGMQLLFESSEEQGEHPGLGLIPGKVRQFRTPGIKVPQTGWNQIEPSTDSPLLAELIPGSYAYFNHGFYCEPAEPPDVAGVTEYGIRYASVTARDRLYGVQFHPEKSQDVGLLILRNFVEAC